MAFVDFKSPVMYGGRCERYRPLDYAESKPMRSGDQSILNLGEYEDLSARIIVR